MRPFAVLIAVFLLLPAVASAQTDIQAPVELQETDIFGMGARALGMGGAYTAVSEDVSALMYNPAGLAQIRRVELSGGMVNNDVTRDVTHFGPTTSDDLSSTRLDHLALAYPVPTYRGSLVLGIGFHRMSDLDMNYYKEGLLVAPTASLSGLYEYEEFQRDGALNAFTAAAAIDLSPNISVGASLSYINGSSDETWTVANYRAVDMGDYYSLDVGGDDFADRGDQVFYQEIQRSTDVNGYTGSLGFLGYLEGGIRVGLTLDLPVQLNYEGNRYQYLEDWDKIDEFRNVINDDITMPLSVSGGASWGRQGLLLSGGFRWTDYTQIDYNGEILAPPEGASLKGKPAYKSVVAVNFGAEYQIPTLPVRVRGGFFTEPIPYKLLAADTDFAFDSDFDPDTYDDISVVYQDYPQARIVTDRKYWTAGAGVLLQDALSLDVAVVTGKWERETPADYENGTSFYPTLRTREKVSQTRIFASATVHFE